MSRGDRVLIYMPMIPEAVEAMLATVRLGAIHSVVFGGKITKSKVIMYYISHTVSYLYSLINMRQLNIFSIKPKHNMRLFVDFCIFT